jgi:hypothetical protein
LNSLPNIVSTVVVGRSKVETRLKIPLHEMGKLIEPTPIASATRAEIEEVESVKIEFY